MIDPRRHRTDRGRTRRALATTAALAALALGAAACTSAQDEAPAEPSSASDAGGSDGGSPSGAAPDEESPSSQEAQTRAAGDDPTTEPESTWEAPADPGSTGPTAAPEVDEAEAGIDETAEVEDGLVVSLGDISATEVVAATPGEVDGTALVVEVEIGNDGEETQDLASTTVSVETADGELAVPTSAEPFAPFEGELAAGETASALYVFMLEDPEGREVTVTVQPTPGETASVFTGTTP